MTSKRSRRTPSEVLLAAEAVVWLGCYRVALRVVPVRRIIRAVTRGAAPGVAAAFAPDATDVATALRVRWAVEAATRNARARFVCFPQALAGYTMLRRRGVPGTIVYGVARSAEGELIAHTWLTVGDRVVLGGEGSAGFSVMDRWS